MFNTIHTLGYRGRGEDRVTIHNRLCGAPPADMGVGCRAHEIV